MTKKQFIEMGSFDAAFKELSRQYQGNGGTALAMMTKLQRIPIGMVTRLDDKTANLLAWNVGLMTGYQLIWAIK